LGMRPSVTQGGRQQSAYPVLAVCEIDVVVLDWPRNREAARDDVQLLEL
jgi:hypothetical protein